MSTTHFHPDRDIPDLNGKVILITGGTAGLGAESVIHIAKHRPAAIYFTGRRAANASTVIERVKLAAPDANILFIECDLASLASVKVATDKFLAVSDRLDVLMCNAGIMATPLGVTEDGFEIQFGTNHVGHALLIKNLLPTLLRTAIVPGADVRVIVLTSLGFQLHPRGEGICFDSLKSSQDFGIFGPWTRYGQSKLANVLYARELAHRYPELTVVSIHPGLVNTALVDGVSMIQRTIIKTLVYLGSSYITLPEKGAYNQLWGAFGDKTKVESGQLYEPIGQLSQQLNLVAQHDQLGTKLWEWTEETLTDY